MGRLLGPSFTKSSIYGIPMDTTYSVEEREKQIALLRELRLKRRQGQDLRPTSLVQAAREGTALSKRELKAMVETQYQSPVISLYMSLGPEAVAPKRKSNCAALSLGEDSRFRRAERAIFSSSDKSRSMIDI